MLWHSRGIQGRITFQIPVSSCSIFPAIPQTIVSVTTKICPELADELLMDYDKLFEDALNHVLDDYSENKIRFYSERDLQGHLFYECRRLMEERSFPFPLKLYTEKSVFDRRTKVDLVLGDNEILVELKLEPDYPGVSKPVVFSTKRESGGYGSVEDDLEKIEKYARRGKCAHFVMIDEDGHHIRRIATEKWKTIPVKRGQLKKPSHYLHVKQDGRRRAQLPLKSGESFLKFFKPFGK